MIAEIRLVSNDGASTAAFWGAIFHVEPEDLGEGWWRIEPAVGPDVVVSTAAAVEAITSCDMIVGTDAGAPDRLRQLGFEVAHDGSQAVDVNGTNGNVFLVTDSDAGWDGYSDFYEDDPSNGEKARLAALPVTATTGRVEQIQTTYPGPVTKFLAAWFRMTPDRQVPGVARFVVRDTLIRVSRTDHPERRWIPLGSHHYSAAVARCTAAGFTVIPSADGPVGGHVELGGHVWLLVDLPRDDAYYAGLSATVEAGDYEAAGPVELGPGQPECER
ncbi:hypothetical protein [Mycolicibacterium llatzerense]|uniref:hypothetical protein n=1 Tax=Mycolicibacterium llatzerense TaxID=280871 RepID=UPI0008DE3654|nr:hypothetical protein [Mycolicibacterium llatzerense]